MGLMASYTCAGCGYVTGTLHLGGSPDPERFDPRLVSCVRCKTLRVVDRAKSELGCGKHRKPFTMHDDEERVPCPKCGAMLRQDSIGTWD